MTHLLDTHVLLWLLTTPQRVPEQVRVTLGDRTHRLLVSAASAMEIATKVRIGKLDASGLVTTLPRRLSDIGAEPLPISLCHAVLAGSLNWEHRDPFDRLLVAQAMTESATLVTVDAVISALAVPRILTW